jgi:hypothetical protein
MKKVIFSVVLLSLVSIVSAQNFLGKLYVETTLDANPEFITNYEVQLGFEFSEKITANLSYEHLGYEDFDNFNNYSIGLDYKFLDWKWGSLKFGVKAGHDDDQFSGTGLLKGEVKLFNSLNFVVCPRVCTNLLGTYYETRAGLAFYF